MSVTIKCQKCGAENRLGQLFCRECGTKLDLSKLTPEEVARSNRPGLGASVGRLIRLAIFLALLGVLGLLCWPVPPAGDAASAQGAAIVDGKMAALRGAILRRNEARETFAEADINAHLNSRLASAPGGGALNLVFKEVRLDLQPGVIQTWTKSTLGPLSISYTTVSKIHVGDGGRITLTAESAKLGHCPLPGPLKAKVVGQVSGMFLRLNDEYILLQRLPVVEIADGLLNVATSSAP